MGAVIVDADLGMSTSLRQHMRPLMSSNAVHLMRQRVLRSAPLCKIQNMRLNMKVSAQQLTRLFVRVMVEEEVDTMMNNCLLMLVVEKEEKEMEDLMEEKGLEVALLVLHILLQQEVVAALPALDMVLLQQVLF